MIRRSKLALGGILLVGVAHAQSPRLTKAFQAGIDAYRLGKYDEARKHLEKARDLDPKLPGPHRFLAAVAQAKREFDECIAETRIAIELNPRSSEIADTRKLHADCRAAAGRAPYVGELGESAAIAVTTNVTAATVKINGLTYGGTPVAPRPIAAGTLEVEITKAGYRPITVTVNALAGIVTDVGAELVPDPTETTAEVAPERDAVRPAPAPPRTERDHRGFYVLAAAGVLVVAGVVTALVSNSAMAEAREIDEAERARDPSDTTPVRTRADLEAAVDRGERWALVSNVSYGVGLAAAGAGIYLLLTRQHRDAAPVSVAPLRGGAYVSTELRW